MEGLEDPDSSPDNSDNECDQAPTTSGTYKALTSDYVKMAPSTGQWPGGSEDSICCSSVTNTAKKSQEETEPVEEYHIEVLPINETAADKCEAASSLTEEEQANASKSQQAVSQLQGHVSMI